MGVNQPRAHIMLDAHTALARWAGQQGLMKEGEVQSIHQQVEKLLKAVSPTASPREA